MLYYFLNTICVYLKTDLLVNLETIEECEDYYYL